MATILIAEDSPKGRKLLAALLNYAGHTVLQARDGGEALALTRREHPDLVITDVLMPNMDGYEFVRLLRADIQIARTPVVFHTATYDERKARLLAEQCGVLHILAKPTDAEHVLRVVSTVLKDQRPHVAPALPVDFEQEHLRLVSDRLVRSTRDLEALNGRLAGLIDLGLRLASEEDPAGLLETACDGACALLGAQSAVIHLNGDRAEEPAGSSIGNQATGASQLRSAFASPSHGYGWIVVQPKLGAGEFSADDQHLLNLLAAQLALAYENAQRALSLAAAVRARDEFLAVAAHELKTPLTSLLTSAQLLLLLPGQAPDPAVFARRLKTIDDQVRRISGLISRLLDVSRIQLGRLVLDPEVVDLSKLVLQAVASNSTGARGNQLLVRADAPALVNVDPLRIEQVVSNLLDNAFKFSPGGEPIEVGLQALGTGMALLVVRDHGIGIPSNSRDKIFDRFYQAHSSDHRSGLGLGLFISREIVELHGGRIRVEFPADGGTRIFVEVPLWVSADSSADAESVRAA